MGCEGGAVITACEVGRWGCEDDKGGSDLRLLLLVGGWVAITPLEMGVPYVLLVSGCTEGTPSLGRKARDTEVASWVTRNNTEIRSQIRFELFYTLLLHSR